MNVRSTADTIVQIAREHAQTRPRKVAYTFLVDGEENTERLTFSELDLKARAIAAELQRLNLKGERALLVYPPGLEFITGLLGCFYAGVTAVPAYPPDPSQLGRSLARLAGIASDCRPALVLAPSLVVQMAKQLGAQDDLLASFEWLATDAVPSSNAADWKEHAPDPRSLALLQYTSGSTGAPKGVMLTHANVLHNQHQQFAAFDRDEGADVVGWLPVFHDMGLIGNVLQPLYCGAHSVLMSPVHFIQKPMRWLRAIHRYRPHSSGGPNFGYELCVRRASREEIAELDLSSWRAAYVGAEPIRWSTLSRFAETFAAARFSARQFFPCYGLAEGTLFVTGELPSVPPLTKTFSRAGLEAGRLCAPVEGEKDPRVLVGCGRPWLDQEMKVVDPSTRHGVAAGEVGEIWVRGGSVGTGYWGRPRETEETFAARTAPDEVGPYLRTGDLGAIIDESLFITGRLKDLIILRGKNHHPHDLEHTAETADPSIRPGCCAATSVEVEEEERLVVIAEVDPARDGFDAERVTRKIRSVLSETHELQAHAVVLLAPRTIFKTSSGKIRRAACREGYLAGTLTELARSVLTIDGGLGVPSLRAAPTIPLDDPDALAGWLSAQVARLANVPESAIDTESALSELGLDSRMLVEWAEQLSAALKMPISPALFFEHSTIDALSRHLWEQAGR